MTQQDQRWSVFGRQLALRVSVHFAILMLVWIVVIVCNGFFSAGIPADFREFVRDTALQVGDLHPAILPGALTIFLISLAWSWLGFGVSVCVSVVSAGLATAIAALYSRFPIPEQAPYWLVWAGNHTPRGLQLTFILGLALSSIFVLTQKIVWKFESLSSDDRLALTPEDEDLAYRALVQSVLKFLAALVSIVVLWMSADIRPVPVVATADSRELRPSVILLATDHPQQLELMKQTLGPAQFSSWSVFGSPEPRAKFDEILQCRYPIRLMGQVPQSVRGGMKVTNDYLLTSALDSEGFSVNLLHVVSPGESSKALQMFSRAYAHIRLFRSFGLLMRSRVFHTPDVQLAQIREALSTAVGRGEPAFISASMLSHSKRLPTQDDVIQFKRFLDALTEQNWIPNLIFVVLEFPYVTEESITADLSLQRTMGRVSIWMPPRMVDHYLVAPSTRLIRGIDLGASLAARLRLTGIVAQCDGTSLFDLTERPSIFPRDLVYQEHEVMRDNSFFRKRGWLSSDGYRLEVRERFEGASFYLYKFSMQSLLKSELGKPIEEIPISEENVAIELNRQLDDFLRSAGVEILNLGHGRTAYSEPFRRIRLLER